jgi:hypothetical protein
MEPEGNFGALSAINGSKNGSKFGRGEPFLKLRNRCLGITWKCCDFCTLSDNRQLAKRPTDSLILSCERYGDISTVTFFIAAI